MNFSNKINFWSEKVKAHCESILRIYSMISNKKIEKVNNIIFNVTSFNTNFKP